MHTWPAARPPTLIPLEQALARCCGACLHVVCGEGGGPQPGRSCILQIVLLDLHVTVRQGTTASYSKPVLVPQPAASGACRGTAPTSLQLQRAPFSTLGLFDERAFRAEPGGRGQAGSVAPGPATEGGVLGRCGCSACAALPRRSLTGRNGPQHGLPHAPPTLGESLAEMRKFVPLLHPRQKPIHRHDGSVDPLIGWGCTQAGGESSNRCRLGGLQEARALTPSVPRCASQRRRVSRQGRGGTAEGGSVPGMEAHTNAHARAGGRADPVHDVPLHSLNPRVCAGS